MIRAVLDANTIVSGMARFRTGTTAPAVILRAWTEDQFELLISDHIFSEVVRTLAKPWFRERVERDSYHAVIAGLAEHATPVSITDVVAGVATHSEDDLVLATVVSAGAEYLVTGDKQLQRLISYQGVDIVTPAMFQAILDTQMRSVVT